MARIDFDRQHPAPVSVSQANLSPPTQTEAPQVVGRESSCEHRRTCRDHPTSTGLQALRPLHAFLAGYPPQRCCCIPKSKIVRELQFCTPAHRLLTFWTAQCLLIGEYRRRGNNGCRNKEFSSAGRKSRCTLVAEFGLLRDGRELSASQYIVPAAEITGSLLPSWMNCANGVRVGREPLDELSW